MIILALIGKFGALFSTIPDPVIGGVFCCMFGLITAVGISNLQHVNLNSVRNLFIIGFAVIMGLVIPDYLGKNEGVIDTGNPSLTEVLAKDKSTMREMDTPILYCVYPPSQNYLLYIYPCHPGKTGFMIGKD